MIKVTETGAKVSGGVVGTGSALRVGGWIRNQREARADLPVVIITGGGLAVSPVGFTA